MNRTTGLIATIIGAAVSTPAAAFQFENGTIWPLAVGINGGPTQVVPPEEVTFLYNGQCTAGCAVDILIADPSRPQSTINTADGQPPTIGANGDGAIVRVRQERSGITVEIVGGQGAIAAPQQPTVQQPTVQPPAVQPPTVQAPTAPTTLVQEPTVQAPPPQPPALQAPTPTPDAPSTTQASPSTPIIPPPPAPDYDADQN